jgi:signal transduction histidine kinase
MTQSEGAQRSASESWSELSSRNGRQVTGLAWGCALVSLLISLVALGMMIYGASVFGRYRPILSHQVLNPFITIAFAVMGALVATRHPRNPIGWIFMTVGLCIALAALSSAVTVSAAFTRWDYEWANWLSSWVWIPAVMLPLTFVLLLFPHGTVPSPAWRPVAWAAALGMVLYIISEMLRPGPLQGALLSWNPGVIRAARATLDTLAYPLGALLLLGFLGSLAAFFVRFRRATGIEREQMKWLVYAVGMMLLAGGVTLVGSLLAPGNEWWEELAIAWSNLVILGIGAAAAIAILRHHLYDINLIINRTLVYSALMIGVAALYGLTVGALGSLFQGRGNPLVSLLAIAVAAILVLPMRDRLQRLVNRLMYGQRDDPYAVLAGLSRRLEGSLSPEATLPTVVETIAQTLKLPYVAIALKRDGAFRISASYGTPKKETVQLPLIYQGEMVGELQLSMRSPAEPFVPAEQRLLEDIALHVGVTAHGVLLTEHLRWLADDLQRSREELVKSREEERRCLRRDLHDDLGPKLASLKLNLDVARKLVGHDPKAAEAILLELRSQSQSMIGDVRRLVFDLRPPALDELGLIGAIHEYTRQIASQDGLRVTLESPRDLPTLPAAVEVAVYRIILEALANFVRHSHGSECAVKLSESDHYLQVEVCDDGQGIRRDVKPGVGLSSMRERAAELGGTCAIEALPEGGTRVLARVPLG